MKWSKELVRYAVIGAATNVSGFLLYVLFTTLGVSPVLTISIFYPLHIGLAFCLNKKWSFGHKGRNFVSAGKYLLSYTGCYALNVFALKILNEKLGYSHLIVQTIAVVVIALLLFVLQKRWVFADQSPPVSPAEAS